MQMYFESWKYIIFVGTFGGLAPPPPPPPQYQKAGYATGHGHCLYT